MHETEQTKIDRYMAEIETETDPAKLAMFAYLLGEELLKRHRTPERPLQERLRD